MKKYYFLFIAFLSLFSSCKTYNLAFVDDEISVDQHEREITYKEIALTIPLNRAFYNLGDEKINLYSHEDQISVPIKKYTRRILHEAKVSGDSILSVIPGKMIVVKSDTSLFVSEAQQADYSYQWDFKNDIWICCGRSDAIPNEIDDHALAYYRSVYRNKKQNRVVVKDLFKGITVIYIVQGENSKIADVAPSLFTTRVWSPPQFNNFITTAFYLKDKVDCVSQQIAINLKNAIRYAR